jgi:hypothetical protein
MEMNGKGYKAVLILVVGLTAFSSAVKELNQIRQFGADASQLVAQWSEKLMPAEVPPSAIPMVAKLERCGSHQSEPAVELPWLEHVSETEETTDIEEPEVAPAPPVTTRTKIKRAHPAKVDPVQFQVRMMNDEVGAPEVPVVHPLPDFSFQSPFQFKSRKQSFIRMNPRDREILKTLNRSINLRIAG